MLVGTFSATLELLPGASGGAADDGVVEVAAETWASCRENHRPPDVVMRE